MSEAYRQKLLHWFMSMLALLLMTALAAASFWFLRAPEIVADDPPYLMANIAGPFGESFTGFIVGFFPIALWHLADFLERIPGRSRWGLRLTRYRSFAAIMGISYFGSVLAASALFNKTYCSDWQLYCYDAPAEWLYFLWLAPLLLACALAMAKLLRLIFIRFIWD